MTSTYPRDIFDRSSPLKRIIMLKNGIRSKIELFTICRVWQAWNEFCAPLKFWFLLQEVESLGRFAEDLRGRRCNGCFEVVAVDPNLHLLLLLCRNSPACSSPNTNRFIFREDSQIKRFVFQYFDLDLLHVHGDFWFSQLKMSVNLFRLCFYSVLYIILYYMKLSDGNGS